MYVRIVTVPLQAGTEDEYSRIMREREAASVAEASPGYRGAYGFVGRTTHRGGTISFWETEADADAFTESSQRHGVLSGMSHILAGEPEVETYEVTVEGSSPRT